MGCGGMAAVLVAMLAALTVLPALLAVLGRRVDALPVRPSLRRPSPPATRRRRAGAWARLAHSVMRRPVLYAVGVVAVLLLAGAAVPAGQVRRHRRAGAAGRHREPGGHRDPRPRTSRQNEPAPIEAIVTAAGPGDTPDRRGGAAVRAVDGGDRGRRRHRPVAGDVRRVTVAYQTATRSRRRPAPWSADIRAVPAPPGGEVLVGGQTARLADLLDSLAARLPWMALIVVGADVRAAVPGLRLGRAAGQGDPDERAVARRLVRRAGLDLPGRPPVGSAELHPDRDVEATQPILVLAIVFGLSMDYEVFLMSRIREQYDRTGDNTAAVAAGLQRTGGIITSAALLLLVVIGAFSLSGITFIKLIGVAMLIAIVVDATIVRALLVPATMRLLGPANWWAPAPLQRFYDRHGFREAEDPPPVPDPRPAPARTPSG